MFYSRFLVAALRALAVALFLASASPAWAWWQFGGPLSTAERPGPVPAQLLRLRPGQYQPGPLRWLALSAVLRLRPRSRHRRLPPAGANLPYDYRRSHPARGRARRSGRLRAASTHRPGERRSHRRAVPADAVLRFQGAETANGSATLFRVASARCRRDSTYELRARWHEEGRSRTKTGVSRTPGRSPHRHLSAEALNARARFSLPPFVTS